LGHKTINHEHQIIFCFAAIAATIMAVLQKADAQNTKPFWSLAGKQ
jgi:hypothetical protein